MYVANTNANGILEESGGAVTTLVPGFTFDQPAGVAVDTSGNVYVADTGNNKIEGRLPSHINRRGVDLG